MKVKFCRKRSIKGIKVCCVYYSTRGIDLATEIHKCPSSIVQSNINKMFVTAFLLILFFGDTDNIQHGVMSYFH